MCVVTQTLSHSLPHSLPHSLTCKALVAPGLMQLHQLGHEPLRYSTTPHAHECSEWRVVQAPVLQVIVCGVEVPDHTIAVIRILVCVSV
jgi:hypothetical protein